MQSFYPASFERDMGCTPAEWLGWLPAAIGNCEWSLSANQAQVQISQGTGAGTLQLSWQTASPRSIALMRIPRLLVSFRFTGLDDAGRLLFMKRFDLYMQRGGG
jgi:hypothetical protein